MVYFYFIIYIYFIDLFIFFKNVNSYSTNNILYSHFQSWRQKKAMGWVENEGEAQNNSTFLPTPLFYTRGVYIYKNFDPLPHIYPPPIAFFWREI